MSRLRTKFPSMARCAKELARLAKSLGSGDAACLAVLARFVEPDPVRLGELVESLPREARGTWKAALRRLESSRAGPIADAIDELSDFARPALGRDRLTVDCAPVVPEGLLWELLLRELDSVGRRRRGMFFTPQPLVRFLVRWALALAERFGPDRQLHVIDPACGYGGFLIEAARQAEGCHITGIELHRATWAVAHLLGSRASASRPSALLNSNSLLAGQSLRPFILGKSDQQLLPVIVGNPPWSNFGRRNRGPWIDNLLADYRAGLGERKSNLADDAIKFIRWSHYWTEQSGRGIVALVTPNTWLDGLTHRRMRESLLRTFDELFVLDLHGEVNAGGGDENVFGVRTGVAAIVMVKSPGRIIAGPNHVRRYDLTGQRSSKLIALAQFELETAPCVSLRPTAPDWRLSSRPRHSHQRARPIDYASFWPLDRVFQHHISGVQTKYDNVLVAFTADDLSCQVRLWLAQQPDSIEFNAQRILPYLVAPFDRRVVYYDPRLIGRARYRVMRHMLRPNLGLVFMRQSTNPGEYDHFLAVDCLVSDRVFYSRHGAPFLAPLWLDSGDQKSDVRGQKGDSAHHSVPEANFTPDFVAAFSSALGDYQFNPRQALEYLYAVGYSPAFRRHYREELCRGFPRFPLPPNTGTYCALHQLGKQLIELHVGQRRLPPSVRQAEENDSVFRLGGYDVLHRWKSPRAKRGLTPVDEAVLDRLASIGRETRRLMEEIDTVAGNYLLGSPHPPPPGVSMLSTSPA